MSLIKKTLVAAFALAISSAAFATETATTATNLDAPMAAGATNVTAIELGANSVTVPAVTTARTCPVFTGGAATLADCLGKAKANTDQNAKKTAVRACWTATPALADRKAFRDACKTATNCLACEHHKKTTATKLA